MPTFEEVDFDPFEETRKRRDVIAGIESSDRYDALGPRLANGDQALGRYQVMESNLPEWGQKHLGRAVTRDEFLGTPELQDQIFDGQFGEYANKYGNAGAARAWFAGERGMRRGNARDVLGTSVDEYERKFTRAFAAPQPVPTEVSAQARRQPTFEPVDYDPFAEGAPAAATAAPPPVENTPNINAWGIGGLKPTPGPDTRTGAPATVPPQSGEGEKPNPTEFTRQFVTTFAKQNPEGLADSLEMLDEVTPESLRGGLTRGAKWVRENLVGDVKNYEPTIKDPFNDIHGFGDAMTYWGGAIGQGIGSSLPSMAVGAAGAGAGALAAGPVGAVVGGGSGLFTSSYLLNAGPLYRELKELKVPGDVAAKWAMGAGAPMAALDSALPATVLAKLGGLGEAKRTVARGVARRLAEEFAKGTLTEASTEATQQIVEEVTKQLAAGENAPTMMNAAKQVATAFIAGGLGGGPLGAVGGIPQDATQNAAGAAAVRVAAEAVGVTPENFMQTPPPEAVSGEISASSNFAAPDFYSPLRRLVEEKGPNVATAEQWQATIRNAPGVKLEEAQDLNLDRLFARGGKLTKQDVLEYLEDNAIQLTETLRLPTGRTGWDAVVQQNPGARYEDYTLPGERRGYVELLMQLPDREVSSSIAINEKLIRKYGGLSEAFANWTPEEQLEFDLAHANTRDVGDTLIDNNYTTGHWPGNKNVIAHLRMTDRVDVNGTPLLLTEEIQSDWLQAGRNQGFKGQGNAPVQWGNNADGTFYAYIPVFGNVSMGQLPSGRWAVITPHASRGDLNSRQEAEAWVENLRGRFDTRPPDAPFKQSWDELALKRAIRYAVDKGYRRLAFTTGQQQIERYPGLDAEQQHGMREFYDKKLPSIVRKWAKRLGGTVGKTTISGGAKPIYELDYSARQRDVGAYNTATGEFQEFPDLSASLELARANDNTLLWDQTLEEASRRVEDMNKALPASEANEVYYLELPPAAAELVAQGLPLYSENFSGVRVDAAEGPGLDVKSAEALSIPIVAIFKQLGLDARIELFAHPGRNLTFVDPTTGRNTTRQNTFGVTFLNPKTGKREIHVALGQHANPQQLFATVMHEMGHIVQYELYDKLPDTQKIAIMADYQKWRARTSDPNQLLVEWAAERNNAVTVAEETLTIPQNATVRDVAQPKFSNYWQSFPEWFAEQVARWATTPGLKPQTTVQKIYKSIGEKIQKLFEIASKRFGLSYSPEQSIASWLESVATELTAEQYAALAAQVEARTQKINQEKLDPTGEDVAEPQQPETALPRKVIDRIFNGRPPKEAQEMAAQADKFNKIYKWGVGVHQLAKKNPHIKGLTAYVETLALANWNKQNIMDEFLTVLKQWGKLRGGQSDAVAALIDDVTNMVYRSDAEVKQGTSRMPTEAEFAALVAKHGVSEEGVAVFRMIAQTFRNHLDRYQRTLEQEANRITNVVERERRLFAIGEQIKAMKNQPYFPFMRFGQYTVTVKNAAGKVIHFETFQRQRTRDAAAKAIKAQAAPDDTVQSGFLEEDVMPMVGIPPGILDMMAERLQLNEKQRRALEQLRFEMSPAQSFKHRFQNKDRVKGYSKDFKRAFANYGFHGANHLVRAQYGEVLRDLVAATRAEVALASDITTRKQITEYMNNHLRNWLDPKPDWYAARSIAFMWFLGFSPAAAALNLTQTLVTTGPWLGAKFGDHRALPAILRAGTQLNNFYRKGSYGPDVQDFELKAIGEGIRDGTITEAMAPELAAVAEGRNLGVGFGGNTAQRALARVAEAGAFMFQMAEQVNRRIAFRAALKLALDNPNNAYVKKMVQEHAITYQTLREKGWTEAEAAAYVTAKDTVETTQFKYGRDYGPRFMQGRARAVFVFKTFVQNMVFFLQNYPDAAVRSLLTMAFLGGLMGLPGADDLEAAIKAIGYQMFGKDWDVEKEARKFVLELIGKDERGRELTDMIMHGVARKGFGIPQLMDMMGGTVGVDIPMPTFDRSRAVGMGLMLPVDLAKLFGPQTNPNDAIATEAQRASGAVFGLGFNIYRALTDAQLDMDDFKRWEKAMPRALQGVSKAYRAYSEGGERSRTGAQVVKYDVNDTEQMMEIFGMAAGYTPLRQSLTWDRIIAGTDAVKYWDIRRNGMMRQYDAARNDPIERESVMQSIRKFNESLPPEARGKVITSEALKKSMETRARARAAREAGSSVRKSDVPILRKVQELYPDANVTVRRVPQPR
jgi:hypothetical protein